MAQFEITWHAPEFEYREKDVSWYWITIIIASIMVAFSVWQRNFLFGFFVVVAEILMISWGNKKPKTLSFSVRETGVFIGQHKNYTFKTFESWSVDESDDEFAELAFNFHGKLKPQLKMLIPKTSVEELRKNVKPLLKEVEHETSLVDSIEKFLRF